MKSTPKRRFGQHFLRDTAVLERLVRLIAPKRNDIFLEIGAGRGALSRVLCPRVASLVTVEIDRDCIQTLQQTLSEFTSAQVIHGDILSAQTQQYLLSRLSHTQPFRVVGNLPYNISTAIIQRYLNHESAVEDMTFMLQLEVAKRIAASPGNRDYGFLSVVCQYFSQVEMHFRVAPHSFVPQPKVFSAIVTLRPKSPKVTAEIGPHLIEVAKAAFRHRRKTLANSLKLSFPPEADTDGVLASAGIDGQRRPETLSVEEYEQLARTCIIEAFLD